MRTETKEERKIRLMRAYGYLVYRHGRRIDWTRRLKANIKAELTRQAGRLTMYPFAYFEGAAIAEAVRP